MSTDARLEALMDAWLDGSIAPADLAQVQAALADPVHQERFIARCQLEGALRRSGAASLPVPVPRPLAFPLAGALLTAAAIMFLILPGAPAMQDTQAPTSRSTNRSTNRMVTASVHGDTGTWAVATQQLSADAEGALAIHFVPIVINR